MLDDDLTIGIYWDGNILGDPFHGIIDEVCIFNYVLSAEKIIEYYQQYAPKSPISNADGPYTAEVRETIQLDGSGSYDPDGTIVSYDWDFGDGNKGTGVNPTHKYESYGDYTITLTVTDDDGLTNTDATSATIRFSGAPMVQLVYPEGDETLKNTIKIRWYAIDSEDGLNLPMYLYYFDEDDNWLQINDVLDNDGEYSWDTTTLLDQNYKLVIETMDSDNNVGHDSSDWFTIKNHEDPPPENNPPNPPSINGEPKGKAGEEYPFNFTSFDVDGDDIFYFIDWGDDSNSGWLGPYNSGQSIDLSHIWEEQGYYDIRAKCKDVYGDESDWSTFEISMPKSYNNIPRILILL